MNLNDLVLAWLGQHGVTSYPNNSFVVLSQGGVEAISVWDAAALGVQPSTDELNALAPGVAIALSAQADYDALIVTGCQVVSTGTPAISATYALDATTLSQIQALATDCAAGLGFPDGSSTFSYPDISGVPRSFDSTSIVDLYKAIRGLIFSLQTTLAARLQGADLGWPSLSLTIP